MTADRQPNWLLRSLIVFSVAVHGVLGWQMIRHYRSTQITYLELTLSDVFKPSLRNIPRPRIFPKPPQTLKDTPRPAMPEMPRPRQLPKPAAAPTYQSVPEDTVANPTIDTPELPGAALAAWTPPVQAPTIDGRAVANRYMAVVLQLIERNKRYPDRARRFRIQGRVKVAFTITPEGGVEKLAVTRGARSEDLNTAAMEAVRRAAPFPRPPLEAFGGTPRVAVTIVFELS